MKPFILSICCLVYTFQLYCQATEMECSVLRKNNTELLVRPAHYDESILPKPDQKVTLLIYLQNGLGNEKPGYYELGQLTTLRWISETKSISLSIPDNWDSLFEKLGIAQPTLNNGDKVKLLWKH